MSMEVIQVLLETVREDLTSWEFMLAGNEDSPAQTVVQEVVEAKRAVSITLEDFLRRFADER